MRATEIVTDNNPDNIAYEKILEKLGFQIVDDEYNERTGLFHPNYRLTK